LIVIDPRPNGSLRRRSRTDFVRRPQADRKAAKTSPARPKHQQKKTAGQDSARWDVWMELQAERCPRAVKRWSPQPLSGVGGSNTNVIEFTRYRHIGLGTASKGSPSLHRLRTIGGLDPGRIQLAGAEGGRASAVNQPPVKREMHCRGLSGPPCLSFQTRLAP